MDTSAAKAREPKRRRLRAHKRAEVPRGMGISRRRSEHMSEHVQQGKPIAFEWVGLSKQIVRSALILALLLSVAAITAWSQSQAINGTIRGRLFDASGAAVAGGTVQVRNTDTGFVRTVQSNEDGYYVFPNL